jgi:hypothetical protein
MHVMLTRMLAGVCVLAAFAPVAADAATGTLKAADIAGRWSGTSHAEKSRNILTLDIVACGSGWCGIKVEAGDKCGGTALRVDAGAVDARYARFEGTLEVAAGTEPYRIQATIFPPEVGKPLGMRITGNTGGEYRAFRRSFPFEAAMARVKDAVCQAPATVSSLP